MNEISQYIQEEILDNDIIKIGNEEVNVWNKQFIKDYKILKRNIL